MGFFGKLPGAGDFVQRRLPPRFVEAWDRGFELAVEGSRGALGGDWQDAYRASPAWRFLLGPGVCGESAWAGAMGPAADRVGRCFPMVLAAALAGPGDAAWMLRERGGWFDAVERTLAEALADPSIGADSFDARVMALPGPLGHGVAEDADPLRGVDWSAASHWRLPLPTPGAVAAQLAALWETLAATPGAWCLWWTRGGGRVPPCALATRGLPQPAAYAGFLDAARANGPWRSLGVFAPAQAARQADAPRPAADAARAMPPRRPVEAPPPADLSGRFAGPPLPLDPDDVTTPAVRRPSPAGGAPAGAALRRSDGALALVAADDGMPDPRRRAAAAARAVAADLAAGDFADGLRTLRSRLLALHPPLHQAGEDLIDPVMEDGAVAAARVAGRRIEALRIGAAAAWHWRQGQLRALFDAAAPAPAGAGFDDLLFDRAASSGAGLGTGPAPQCDEAACMAEAGDRLLLLATRRLLALPPDVFARALASPSCDEAAARIAAAAQLGPDAAQWPLAIIEIRP
ncbi:hypothetical protein ASG87_06665 [Frateuria sp. Soil773]|nr:hypothetical protein ASG87_06665 [Frateuria sp. Soil773]